MLYSMQTMKDSIARLTIIRSNAKPTSTEEDLSIIRIKLLEAAYDLLLGLEEASHSINRNRITEFITSTKTAIDGINNSENYNGLINTIDNLISMFDRYDYTIYSVMDFRDEYYQLRYDFQNRYEHRFESKLAINTFIAENVLIASPRKVNMFYPDCGQSYNVRGLNVNNADMMVYGNETIPVYAKEAKRYLHKVALGPLRGSRISNDVFDIMFCMPKLDFVFDSSNIFDFRRNERNYISDTFKYVRDGGVMIVAIPFYRLFKDVCIMLSKQMTDIQVLKVSNYDYENRGYVYLIGRREYSKEIRTKEYTMLRGMCYKENVDELVLEPVIQYTLPRSYKPVEIFKGSVLDVEEIAAIISKSSLQDKMFSTQVVEKSGDVIKNPLLPFNIGQLGLVLTSGCLDGVVDEGNGYKHLIKGRVSKQNLFTESDTKDGIEVTETVINKVEINVMMPNGDFKVLT